MISAFSTYFENICTLLKLLKLVCATKCQAILFWGCISILKWWHCLYNTPIERLINIWLSTLTNHIQANMYIKVQRRVQNHDILSAILGLKFKVLFSKKSNSISIHETTTTSFLRHKLYFANCDLWCCINDNNLGLVGCKVVSYYDLVWFIYM